MGLLNVPIYGNINGCDQVGHVVLHYTTGFLSHCKNHYPWYAPVGIQHACLCVSLTDSDCQSISQLRLDQTRAVIQLALENPTEANIFIVIFLGIQSLFFFESGFIEGFSVLY